jgi:hypothetical protein
MQGMMKMHRYLLMAAAILPAILASCRNQGGARFPTSPNQIQPLPSPDRSLLLTVPRWEDPVGNTYWHVTIADTSGTVLYVDSVPEFVGNLNVYWAWDEGGRAWLYNSDDGIVHLYSRDSGAWVHTVYGPAGDPAAPGLPEPPAAVFPAYLNEQER